MLYETRPWRRLALVALLAQAGACGSNEEPVESDTDVAEPVARDTAPTVQYLRPTSAILLASFGYEPSLNAATEYTFGTSTIPAGISFLFANDQWSYSFADEDNYCAVELMVDGNIEAANLQAFPNVMFGFNLPVTAVANGDCNSKLDPNDWPDIGAALLAVDWGVTINTSIDADFSTQLQGSMSAEEWDDFSSTTIGGGMIGTMASALDQSGLFNGGLGSANVADEAITDSIIVVLDSAGDTVPMTTTEMIVGGELQRGAYTVQVGLPFDFFDQLL
jgi:hypothetical protein